MTNEEYIKYLENLIKEKDKDIESKDKALEAKDKALEAKDKALEAKDKALEAKDKTIKEKDIEIEKKDVELKECYRAIADLVKKLEDKDIKLKKQLLDRFYIKSDKAENIITINEAEENASSSFEDIKKEHKEYKKRGRKIGSKDGGNIDYSKVEVIEHTLDIDNKICPSCNHELVESSVQNKIKIEVIPSKVIVHKYKIKEYKCSNCTETVSKNIDIFSDESFLSPSLASFIVNNKYNYALPLYRQENMFKEMGLDISRTGISNYVIDTAIELEPIYEALKKKLIDTRIKVLHADETTFKCLEVSKEENRNKSYIWCYSSNEYSEPIYVYEFTNTRESKYPIEFLKDYNGYLVCDDYHGYNELDNNGIKLMRCWFHANKRYADLLKVLNKKNIILSETKKIYEMVIDIFNKNNKIIEKYKIASLIKENREKILRPLVNNYFSYISNLYNKEGFDKESELGKAIKYSLNIKDDLCRFFEDGHIPLTNNRCERAIKPFVILRKNALFSNTINGARASAILMSIVQTAKANLIKPDKYIEWVLNKIEIVKQSDIDSLLPTSLNLPDELKYKRNEIEK